MAETTWTWRGLIKGDPYGAGAPGKPLPGGVGGAAPKLGSQANPYRQEGQGGPGDWWQGTRAGQFGYPQAAPLPADIGAKRQQMTDFFNLPSVMQPQFDLEHPGFRTMWQGVFNMPQDLPPEAPGSFNLGPQMASVPLGEEAGPSAPWAGWQPAQEEWT